MKRCEIRGHLVDITIPDCARAYPGYGPPILRIARFELS